jgi:hypothetical protein
MDADPRDSRYAQRDSGTDRDSSDVVEGPVGDAHLVDPADAEPLSADLEALAAIDDTEPPDARDGPPVDDTP